MSQASQPRCSVILPTYNRMRSLPRAVASVLAQDMVDFELFIVDDASTDETPRWLAGQNDPRVRVIRCDRNQGPSAARNLGLDAAHASITTFLDSDDIYRPNRLSVPLRVFEREPDVVCTLNSSVKHDRGQTNTVRQPDIKLASAPLEWALMCGLIGVESSSMTVRTKAARIIGGFCKGLQHDEDGEFLIRLARHGAGRLLPEVLWEKFSSTDSISNDSGASGRGLMAYIGQRPEFLHRFRKLGSYRATKILVADLRHRDLKTFFADYRRFRDIGLIDGNIARIWRVHREVRKFRRTMANRDSLAALTGLPQSWN